MFVALRRRTCRPSNHKNRLLSPRLALLTTVDGTTIAAAGQPADLAGTAMRNIARDRHSEGKRRARARKSRFACGTGFLKGAISRHGAKIPSAGNDTDILEVVDGGTRIIREFRGARSDCCVFVRPTQRGGSFFGQVVLLPRKARGARHNPAIGLPPPISAFESLDHGIE